MTLKNAVSPIKRNIGKSNTQNTKAEIYLKTGKIGDIINPGSSKIIPPKKNFILPVWLVRKDNAHLCSIEAVTRKVL